MREAMGLSQSTTFWIFNYQYFISVAHGEVQKCFKIDSKWIILILLFSDFPKLNSVDCVEFARLVINIWLDCKKGDWRSF